MGHVTDEYEEQLKREHARKDTWGSSVLRFGAGDIYYLIKSRKYIRTVLDYGCGKGRLKPYLLQEFPYLEITEYDPGIPGKDVLPDGPFDLVVHCDVFEHIERDCIPAAIKAVADRTRYVLYSNIACSLTGTLFTEGPYVGEDLHITCEDPDWWLKQFEEHSAPLNCHEYRDIKKQRRGNWLKRCTMIHERLEPHPVKRT